MITENDQLDDLMGFIEDDTATDQEYEPEIAAEDPDNEELDAVENVSETEFREAETYINQLPLEDSVKFYYSEVGQLPLLSPQEEKELSIRIQNGDMEARQKMITSNLRLVISIARRYSWHNISMLDLIQEGNAGLIKAVEKFDYTKGYRFSTYGTWWIEQSIKKAIKESDRFVHIPSYMVAAFNKAMKKIKNDPKYDGTVPAIEVIAEEMKISVKQVRDIINAIRSPASLDVNVSEESNSCTEVMLLKDETSNIHEKIDLIFAKDYLENAVGCLPIKSRNIIRLRYGLVDGRQHTLEEVGQEFNVTRERIRQVENQALAVLRKIPGTANMRDIVSDT